MSNTKTVIINRFDGGIVNDPRDRKSNAARMCTNFDALTNPRRLTPYHDTESGDTGAATNQIQNFSVAAGNGGTYRLFGLGVVSGTGKAKIFYKDLTTGGGGDLSDSSWSNTTNDSSSSGATSFNIFTYYKKTGLIYGAKAGTTIWTYDPTGAAAFGDTAHSLSYTNIAEGLVHSKDDILYIPYDNSIAKNNNGSWTDAAITIPSQFYITSICEFGNFLAIAAAPLNGVGGSRVYLWDRDSSLTTLSENIDWGEGILKVISEINGVLIGVSLYGNNSTRFKDRIVFKYYDGTRNVGAQIIAIFQGGTSTQLLSARQKIDNRLLFMMSIELDGSVDDGVWSLGLNSIGQFAIYREITPNNGTALTSGVLKGFVKIGDYLFQSFVNNSNYAMTKSNDQAVYTATSTFDTTINPNVEEEDYTHKKQLNAVSVSYAPFDTNDQVVLKYRVDADTSWTTIFTETTDNSVATVRTKITNGTSFTAAKEIQFRLESTGGAEITELKYRYEVLEEAI